MDVKCILKRGNVSDFSPALFSFHFFFFIQPIFFFIISIRVVIILLFRVPFVRDCFDKVLCGTEKKKRPKNVDKKYDKKTRKRDEILLNAKFCIPIHLFMRTTFEEQLCRVAFFTTVKTIYWRYNLSAFISSTSCLHAQFHSRASNRDFLISRFSRMQYIFQPNKKKQLPVFSRFLLFHFSLLRKIRIQIRRQKFLSEK